MIDGVLLYDKPAGVTSHDIVARVRRGLAGGASGGRETAEVSRDLGHRLKVGHAGTLDPFATGLLLILLGRAARVQRFLMALPKTYEATARFGYVSSTGDPEGELVCTGVVPAGDLELPRGVIRQRPPAYSAVKLRGRRAYALARAGAAVQLPEREVEVYRFEELGRDGEWRRFLIECSSGTYVRSLVADLGDAYCEQLRRSRIGTFDVADADPDHVVPLDRALAFIPELKLDGEPARRATHGAAIAGQAPGVVRLTDEAGLIALAEPVGDGHSLKPIVGFRG